MRALFKGLRVLDWVLGFGFLGYGLYTGSLWWMAGGVLSLAVAWLKPAERVKHAIERRVLGKRTRLAALANSEDQNGAAPAGTSTPAANRGWDGTFQSYAGFGVSRSKHNQLTADAFNHYPGKPR